MRKLKMILLLFVLISSTISCVSIKSYQKAKLNDKEMSLSANPIERFEANASLYREAASGANGGKSGGGCGCN